MENRDLDSTYDSRKDWHLMMHRGDRFHTVNTYDEATEVIAALLPMVQPERVIVWHVPSDVSGNGETFLAEVNRRMKDNG